MANSIESQKLFDSDKERLEDAKEEFRYDWDSDKPWRSKRKEWLDFYHGRQWSTEEIEELKRRGQPAVVRNRIKPKVDAMVGIELALKVNTKALDRGSDDEMMSRVISEALRLIEDRTDFDTVEAKAFSDMLKTGRGWYQTAMDWVDFEAFTTTERLSTADVVPDRNGRKDDMGDWKRVHHTFFMDVEDAVEIWPDSEEGIRSSVKEDIVSDTEKSEPHRNIIGDQYNNPNSRTSFLDPHKKLQRVRIVRTWYRTYDVKKFLTHPDIGTEEITEESEGDIKNFKKAFQGAQIWIDRRPKMNYITFCDNAILEDEKDVRSYDKNGKFPITLLPGWWDEENNYHIGIIEQLLDPQREVNKRGSKMLHLLNTNQVELEDGAVDDLNQLRFELSRPDGVIVRKKGRGLNVIRNLDIAQSQFQLLQEAKGEIDAAGAASELVGASQATSGRDFQLRQQAAIQPIRELFLNARGSRQRVGKLWLDDIQQFWSGPRLIKLTDDPKAGAIELNKRIMDPITGQIIVLNDVSLGNYDIKIDESPDTTHLRSENFDQLIRLAELGVPIPPDMIVEASDLPDKQKYLERMQQSQPQQQLLPAGQ